MQIRVCDRCGVPVPEALAPAFIRGITIPTDLPASAAVPAKTTVNLAIVVQAPADLCAPCRLSAMAEYVAQEIKASAAPGVIQTFGARVLAILQGTA